MANAVSRRALLATPLALAACSASAPVAAAPSRTSDELAWMIDTYEEIRQQRSLLLDEMVRIDPPGFSGVALREVASRPLDYEPAAQGTVFLCEREVKSFFASRARLVFGGGYRARIETDFRMALNLYRERRAAHEAYLAASGFPALEERDDALYGKQCEIEGWIRAYTCRSRGDMLALALFASAWFPGDDFDMEMRSDILRAISGFLSDYALAAA